MQEMDIRLGSLEGAYVQVADRLHSIDARLISMDGRLELVRSDMGHGFELMRRSMDQRFAWLVGIIITCFGTAVAVLHH